MFQKFINHPLDEMFCREKEVTTNGVTFRQRAASWMLAEAAHVQRLPH
ncbi:hypothetical protein SAMN05216388_103716 [Halorientalis persicus]|uniref:Uncharacterized protein n=1 Tax=Halorientalis persicus TaxID=1367881 RepID=A0A1H8VG61_9EURY|nr:hypothetical protein SAMN05216388_103716 [Halorientalis persicus]